MFKEHHGLQCGCVLRNDHKSIQAFAENSNPTEEDVRFGMSGNYAGVRAIRI